MFQVNGSRWFCGVAEMVGPVEFNKSMDFWQQDKWTESFSVRWHIIKDIPNAQLRHIILENNDNKHVTNSRDTQDVNNLALLSYYEHSPWIRIKNMENLDPKKDFASGWMIKWIFLCHILYLARFWLEYELHKWQCFKIYIRNIFWFPLACLLFLAD